MIWISRILLLLVFALFWGGLTFYTGIVVRISHDLLGDPMEGGLITQRVTAVLQGLGVVTVILMAVNCAIVIRQSVRLGYMLALCATILACSLVGLFIVHGMLDAVIDAESYTITDRQAFEAGHRYYNRLTAIQWLAALAYLPTTLFAWRSIDRSEASVDSQASELI